MKGDSEAAMRTDTPIRIRVSRRLLNFPSTSGSSHQIEVRSFESGGEPSEYRGTEQLVTPQAETVAPG